MGTPGNDNLRGTPGDDVIHGLGGDDVIDGRGGRDLICGGAGEDTLFGGGAPDNVAGMGADDIIAGDRGADRLLGGDGDVDAMLGGLGNDIVYGGPGVADTASFLSAPSAVQASLQAGTATGGDGSDELDGVENLQGSPHNDVLEGDDELNFLIGSQGNDGSDQLDGRGGFDLATFFFAEAPLFVNLATGSAEGQGSDQLSQIEGAAGGPLADALTGDGATNRFFGGAGSDELIGAAGDDYLSGEEGQDHLQGQDGDDALSGGEADDDLNGGADRDTATYGTAPDSVVADLALGAALGEGFDLFSETEGVTGSPFPDELYGDASSNSLDGGRGDDLLKGLGGKDTLFGEEDNDELSGGGGGDGLLGGEGTNTLNGGSGTDHCFDPVDGVACETGAGGAPDALSSSDQPEPPTAVPAGSAAGEPQARLLSGRFISWPSDVQCSGNQLTQPGPPFHVQKITATSSWERIWWTTQLQRWNGAQWVTDSTRPWIEAKLFGTSPNNVYSPQLTQSYTVPPGYWRGIGWVYWQSLGDMQPFVLGHTRIASFGYTNGEPWCQFF